MDIKITEAAETLSQDDFGSSRRSYLAAKRGLTADDMAQVQALADAVGTADGVGLKLNLPRQIEAQHIADRASDFCYYNGEHLVGYAPLDGDDDELEVTAAVLPSYRRQGIFRLLLDAARQEAHRRGTARLLLVGYRASLSGVAAVKALRFHYVSSEYRMKAEAAALPPLDPGRVRLVLVDVANMTDLVRLMGLTFGARWSAVALTERLQETGVRYFIAEADNERIGQIGVVDAESSLYVRSVGIVPECRRRGYGRQLLAVTLQAMLTDGYTQFELDVATDNPQALSLYEACGFHATDVYDYYKMPLTIPLAAPPPV